MELTTTYTVIIDQEDLTVIADRTAGVSGPVFGVSGPVFTEARPGSLTDADQVLKSRGFRRGQDWLIGTSYLGMTLRATVERIPHRPRPETLDGWPLLPGESLLGPAQ